MIVARYQCWWWVCSSSLQSSCCTSGGSTPALNPSPMTSDPCASASQHIQIWTKKTKQNSKVDFYATVSTTWASFLLPSAPTLLLLPVLPLRSGWEDAAALWLPAHGSPAYVAARNKVLVLKDIFRPQQTFLHVAWITFFCLYTNVVYYCTIKLYKTDCLYRYLNWRKRSHVYCSKCVCVSDAFMMTAVTSHYKCTSTLIFTNYKSTCSYFRNHVCWYRHINIPQKKLE